jgi:multidrug efflux pump subunit AcrA (membrane-fusion protein)
MGLVKNWKREHRGGQVLTTTSVLYAGQFATALIELPAPPGVVSVPSSALDETGSESILFVWPDPSRPRFTLKRVVVARRFGNTVYVRSKLTPQQERQGLEPLHPGERVVTQAAVEMKTALEEVQTRARAQTLSVKSQ